MSASVLSALKAATRRKLGSPIVATVVPTMLRTAAILVFEGSLTSRENEQFKRFLVSAVKARITKGAGVFRTKKRNVTKKRKVTRRKKRAPRRAKPRRER